MFYFELLNITECSSVWLFALKKTQSKSRRWGARNFYSLQRMTSVAIWYFTSWTYLQLDLHGVFYRYNMYGDVHEILNLLLPFLLWLDSQKSCSPYGHVSFLGKFEHCREKEI